MPHANTLDPRRVPIRSDFFLFGAFITVQLSLRFWLQQQKTSHFSHSMASPVHANDSILIESFFNKVCSGLKQAPKERSALAPYFAAVHEFSEPFVDWTPSPTPSPPSSPSPRPLTQYTSCISALQEEGDEPKLLPRKRKRDVSSDGRSVKRTLLQDPRPPSPSAAAKSNTCMHKSSACKEARQDDQNGQQTVARKKDLNEDEDNAYHKKFGHISSLSPMSQDEIAQSSAAIKVDMSTIWALQNALRDEIMRRERLEKRYAQLSKNHKRLQDEFRPRRITVADTRSRCRSKSCPS
jgi:hypothetical protein